MPKQRLYRTLDMGGMVDKSDVKRVKAMLPYA